MCKHTYINIYTVEEAVEEHEGNWNSVLMDAGFKNACYIECKDCGAYGYLSSETPIKLELYDAEGKVAEPVTNKIITQQPNV